MSVTAVPLQPIAKGALPKLWLGIGLIIAAAAALAWLTTGDISARFGTADDFLAHNARQDGVEVTESGLQYEILEEGQGPSPQAGDFALINYEGRFRDGESFDSGESIPFALGEPLPGINAVTPVEGFREALALMNTGARYRIWLPPELGYGDNPPEQLGADGDTVLVFDIEMLEFVSRDQLMMGLLQMQQQQMGAPPPGGQ